MTPPMTPPTIQTTAELVERLHNYVAALVTEPESPTDLRVGKAMCANAMSEAANRLEHLERALTERDEALIELANLLAQVGFSQRSGAAIAKARALTQSGNK